MLPFLIDQMSVIVQLSAVIGIRVVIINNRFRASHISDAA
jgi:hypothetical protein